MLNFLYIDPGTGSMLFSLAIGIGTAAVFALRVLAVKLRFLISGGKVDKIASKKIPYVIFSDHKRYWNVFKPICDEFEKRKINLVYYTQSSDDPVLSQNYEFVKSEFIGEGNKGFVKMNMLNAGIVLATTPGLDVLQWKRSKTVDKYIHIPHSVDELSLYRMFGLDFYDAVICSGQNQIDSIRKLENLRPNAPKKELLVLGSTYMDNAYERVKSFAKTINEVPVVLVAPSWGVNSLLNRFGEKLLSVLVDSGYKIIVRPHPQSLTAEKGMLENLQRKFPEGIVEWNFDNDNLAVLNRADIMISDFSSVIYDFAFLFERPVIYTKLTESINTLPFDADWINETPWCIEAPKNFGYVLDDENLSKVKDLIIEALKSKSISEGRNLVKADSWANVSNAAKSIVDYLVSENKGSENDKK